MPLLRADGSDFRRFAAAVKGADKDVRRALGKGIRDAAKPLGAEVARKGAEPMPSAGGLRERLLQSKVGIRASLASSRPSVLLRISDRQGDDLASINRGRLRHLVYGRRPWVDQRVPAGTYDRAFQRGAPLVRREVRRAVQGVLDDIARKA